MGRFNTSEYNFEILPGPEGNGTFLFSLLIDELNQPGSNQIQQEAYIMINDINLMSYPIDLQCQENKEITNTLIGFNGKAITKNIVVNVGDKFNLTFKSEVDARPHNTW
jgi:hypothetical protein